MSKQAIGVFDSGIGGLSTLKELRRQLPKENFIYVADLAWSPYGNKPVNLLQERAAHICNFMLNQNVKAIVIACNTATAAAIEKLRQHYRLPIIGVEPGIKPAISRTLSGVVGILATQRTISSEKFQNLLKQFNDHVRIIAQACPGLAEAIDEGEEQTALRAELLRHFTAPLLAEGADTLVLGCTHYPLVIDEIRQVVGEKVELIDTSAAIARQAVRQLEMNQILNASDQPGSTEFYSTDVAGVDALGEIFSYYWGEKLSVSVLSD